MLTEANSISCTVCHLKVAWGQLCMQNQALFMVQGKNWLKLGCCTVAKLQTYFLSCRVHSGHVPARFVAPHDSLESGLHYTSGWSNVQVDMAGLRRTWVACCRRTHVTSSYTGLVRPLRLVSTGRKCSRWLGVDRMMLLCSSTATAI